MHIKIYTKSYCGYCYAAKNLLMKRGFAFEETELSGNFQAEQEMRDLTGRTTVPQILINGTPVGGYTDLIELDRAGKLDAFRTASGA
jgi:glutaredoxin 3